MKHFPPALPSRPVTVVIANWNSGGQLKTCLESLRRYGGGLIQRVVVVDNGSTDGSCNGLEAMGGLVVVRDGRNQGFARACNHGARIAQSQYILFLNPDAAIREETLGQALTFMDDTSNAQVGICGVQLVDENGAVAQSCARFPTILNLVHHAIGLDRIWPKMGFFMNDWNHMESRRVDHVIGAFFLVRAHVFRALGGFDERFFLYLEDLDLSFRAHQDGWQTHYLAEVQAFHAGGGASRKIKARRLFYALRSRLVYAHKHFPLAGVLLISVTTVLIEPLTRTGWAVWRRSSSAILETWRAYGMLLLWLPSWIVRGRSR